MDHSTRIHLCPLQLHRDRWTPAERAPSNGCCTIAKLPLFQPGYLPSSCLVEIYRFMLSSMATIGAAHRALIRDGYGHVKIAAYSWLIWRTPRLPCLGNFLTTHRKLSPSFLIGRLSMVLPQPTSENDLKVCAWTAMLQRQYLRLAAPKYPCASVAAPTFYIGKASKSRFSSTSLG